MHSGQLITLIGNIGSGKTTATPIIAQALNASILYADDLFQTANPFQQHYLDDMSRWALTTELWMTFERTKLLQRHLKQNPNQITVIDSGLLMSWVYAHSHYCDGVINPHEWKLYENLYHHLTKDVFYHSHVVFFSYSIATLKKRIKKRGRAYELKYYNTDYLNKIEKGLQALIKVLRGLKIKVHVICESDIKDFETNAKDRRRLIREIKTLPLLHQF
ncbi:deoxynucleoside kinase [Patescibacteria group bacterium]|nr:deoxynucleoside kinase [Patescibacteria group bacterium]MCL5091737.1 deoxynucleoside kinase [Patescibacteria group bacterium]